MNILLPRAYFQTRGSQTSLIYTKTLCTHIFFLVPFFVLKHAPHVSPSLSRRDRSILSLSLSRGRARGRGRRRRHTFLGEEVLSQETL